MRQILLTTRHRHDAARDRRSIRSIPAGNTRRFCRRPGRLHVRWFQVQLVCEEQATYQQGTDTRTATAIVHRETVFSERKFDIPPGEAFETHFPCRRAGRGDALVSRRPTTRSRGRWWSAAGWPAGPSSSGDFRSTCIRQPRLLAPAATPPSPPRPNWADA